MNLIWQAVIMVFHVNNQSRSAHVQCNKFSMLADINRLYKDQTLISGTHYSRIYQIRDDCPQYFPLHVRSLSLGEACIESKRGEISKSSLLQLG